MKILVKVFLLFSFTLLYTFGYACTNVIVTKGASVNNANMIAYTCDGEFHPHLKMLSAMDHSKGDSIAIRNYQGGIVGKIAQVKHTYKVMGYSAMNEFQVAMGETTFGGRDELVDRNAFLHYWQLMGITLQRAKTAREAIKVLTDLVAEYGYGSEGESISICDKDEAWLLEISGMGVGNTGAVWVAVKIPDGMICAHANKARIGTFDMKDKKNCLYSKNVVDFAVEKGYYDTKSGEPFRFNEAYDPSNPANLRYSETRVWSIFRRAAPSQIFSSDYHRGVKGAKRYPLYIKPDFKIEVAGMFSLIRDHYEGTPYDMTKGIAAGNYNNPNRWRPLRWEVDGKTASWERAISTYNTGFSIVTVSRKHLPNPIGGVVWYGLDDTYFSCFTPIYMAMDSIPLAYRHGKLNEFDIKSAWWVFNLVSNYTNLRFSDIVKEVQQKQSELESTYIAEQISNDAKALKMYKSGIDVNQFLSDYSFKSLNNTYDEWLKLFYYIVTKYNDGYIKGANGRPQEVGYPKAIMQKAVTENPKRLMPVWEDKNESDIKIFH